MIVTSHLWFLGIPCWATVLWKLDCDVARLVASIWVVSILEHNFLDLSYTVVEQTPFRLKVVV